MTRPKRNDGRYWLWSVGSAPPSSPEANPIAKPPSVAETQPVHPADDDAREHDDRALEREVRRHERGLHRQEHRHDRREQAGDEDGGPDHPVRAHAEQPRGPEVHRRRAHVQADPGALEQQHQRRRGRAPRRRSRRS